MRFQRKRFSVDGRALNFISFTNLTLEKNGKKFAQNFLNILRIFGGVIDAEKIIKKLTLLFGQFLFLQNELYASLCSSRKTNRLDCHSVHTVNARHWKKQPGIEC